MKDNVFFITGSDTGVGKTLASGILARELKKNGVKVITQKPVQTGSSFPAEDIIEHRKIMDVGLTNDDLNGKTSSYVFSFPASPHLAAEIDGKLIDISVINSHTKYLSENYDIVIQEGAGGLMVPMTRNFLTIDYIAENNFPVIFVTNSELGSINRSLLSLEAIKMRKLRLKAIIYNEFDKTDSRITNDTGKIIFEFADKLFKDLSFIKINRDLRDSGKNNISAEIPKIFSF
ncbi:MAG TPA: dethiobiotin synthase [Spirochaetota bacterium]|nr:dethiobiotin synthase [Spirochaetota bacterium]HOR44113.1 dethiobiotin synthase [Spirochaetota bacterium]HPK57026.1 dethiobiotin synthase [Spirochaetota bacterium]HQE60257.1 dethiobiotin synthase [Spirochaetota bacterium]